MPVRNGWTAKEDAYLKQAWPSGIPTPTIYANLPGRTVKAIQLRVERLKLYRPEPDGTHPASADRVQEVSDKQDGTTRELKAHGRTIRTVDDLLRHVEADMTRFEIASSEASKYEGLARDPDGEIRVHEMFRVFVRLKPKAGPTTLEAVEAMIAGALCTFKAPHVRTTPKTKGEVWQFLPIADPHFAKYAWGGATGAKDFDLGLAAQHVGGCGNELLDGGDDQFRPARRTFAFLGDIFHYDTPGGATTAGTLVERDGRYQKMIEVGSDTCIALIERSAKTCPTDVYVVNGNHDQVLSAAFQRILQERFRNDKRVRVDGTYTSRKYLTFGSTLIGIAHGDKAKKKLPQLMSLEVPQWWGASKYREIHTGHFHHSAADWQKPTDTIDGVLVRIAPSIAPADGWHSDHGFIGAPRSMETFFYREAGSLAGMLSSDSELPRGKPRAA